ncbi:MAG: DUF4417 domain-containing protein [Actinomycetes bacterium]
MRVAPTSSAAALLLHGAPEGYPLGHPVDGEQHIPRLRGVPENRVPEVLCAFNDRGRATDPSAAGLHFFRADEALLPIIGSPAKYALTFAPYRLVLTPDLTIGEAMAPWQRARAVAMSRMAGVVWQERGLTVVPTLRWRTKHDYDNVASGIPTHSIVAIATYGSRRDPELRTEFERGLPAMVERLEPCVVLVFGSTKARVFAQLAGRTEFIEYLPPMAARRDARPEKSIPDQPSLFEVA